MTTADGSTWTTLLKLNDNLVDSTNVITVDGIGIIDLAGHQMSGSTDSANYAISAGPTEGR